METIKGKGRSKKILIIALLVVILLLLAVIAYFVLPKGTIGAVKNALASKDEFTLNLDEFIVNLKSESRTKAYLKTTVSLMYTDKKSIKTVDSSVSKMKDIVLNNLRVKTAEEMLDVEETNKLKEKIIEDINTALKSEIIKEVYFTSLVVQ